MDINKNVDYSSFNTSVVFLKFLQQSPCLKQELRLELQKIEQEPNTELEYDGDLETDGHSISINLPRDIEPAIPAAVLAEEYLTVRMVAAELVEIADRFNDNRFSQAADDLAARMRNSTSSSQCWQSYLSEVVTRLLQDIPGEHSERMVMALTFSLLKAVCERAPSLLCSLLNTLVHYTFSNRP